MSRITEAQARAAGFTREIEATSTHYDLSLLVRREAYLDNEFNAFDRECGEFINVNGWLFSIEG